MKKGIIVLLIAVLVSGFAFAKFSGSAGVRFDANLDNKVFLTTNPTSFDFSFTFASEKVEIAGDDEVHVEVDASAKFILGDLENPGNGIWIDDDVDSTRGIGAVISLDTAKIVGKNWYVDITGTQGAYDYAKAAVLEIKNKNKKDDFGNKYDVENQAASYKVDYVNVPGVTVGINDFTASAGFDYIDELFIASASVETPEFAFSDDAVKVQAAAVFNRLAVNGAAVKFEGNAIGVSAKATVAVQDITVKAAVDMGLEGIGAEVAGQTESETEFNIDARVDFKYNFVDFNIYTYAGKEGLEYGAKNTKVLPNYYDAYQDFYLEAKAAFDLNAFDLPLKVTVSAKNITNAATIDYEKAGIVPAIKVEYAKDAIKAAASFDINTESKIWNTLVYGTYAFEKFTAGAGLSITGSDEVSKIAFGAFAESDKIVKGAKFGLSYGLDGGKVYDDGGAKALSGNKFSSNYKAETIGTVNAYCKIAF